MRDLAAPPTVVDFLGECAFDLHTGRLRPLADYLRRFPGHVDAVAREYLTLVDATSGPSPERRQRRIGPFELLRELGRGGQGRVHLAHDRELGRFVALKVLDVDGPTAATRRDRFRREVTALLRLDHPHLCRLFAADVDHTPPFAAMELVAGHSLADLLALGDRAIAASGGVVRPDSARTMTACLRFFELVARAVDAVHQAGIVHRDLKPANVMRTDQGEPRVLDFGLATLAATADGPDFEQRFGTLAYMAPEQLDAGGTVDRRTDVFALGVTLAECATGTRPFPETIGAARLAAIRRGLPGALRRQLPKDLRAIVQQATAADPDARYPTAAALAADLQRAREHRPVLARRTGRLDAMHRWCRRHPLPTTWLLAIACTAAFGSLQTASARAAHAAATAREASVVAAARSLDPWRTTATDSGALARSILLPHHGLDATADTSWRIAMLHLESGDVPAARREIEAPDVPSDDRTAALRLATRLLTLEPDAPLPEGLPASVSDELARELQAVAARLCRRGRWRELDRLAERLLQWYEAERLALPERRTPLRLLQLRSLATQRLDLQLLRPLEGELAFLRRRASTATALAEFEESFLRTAAEVCTTTTPLEAVRTRAQALARAAAAAADDRALRLEAFALGIARDNSAPSFARLEELRHEQARRSGANQLDAVTTTWLLARRIANVDTARARQLLAEAWQHADHLDADHDLRLGVLRDRVRFGDATMGPAAREGLLTESIRAHFATYGPADPRTTAALFERPWPLPDRPEASDWLAQAIAALTALPQRIDDLDRARLAHLQDAIDHRQPWAVEARALELQRGVRSIDLHNCRVARVWLMRTWIGDQTDRAGHSLVDAAIQAATSWRRRLGDHDPGPAFTTEILVALGTALHERGWSADAACALHAAVAHYAAELGTAVHDSMVATAGEFPGPPERRRRHLLASCARAVGDAGDDQGRIRLLQLAVAPAAPLDQLVGTNAPPLPMRVELARALLEGGRMDEAEVELQSLSTLFGDTDGRDGDLQAVRRMLHGILVATGRQGR